METETEKSTLHWHQHLSKRLIFGGIVCVCVYLALLTAVIILAGMEGRDIWLTLALTCLPAFLAVLLKKKAPLFAFLPDLFFAAVNAYIVIQLLSKEMFTWYSTTEGPLHLFGLLWVLAVFLLLYAITGSSRISGIIGNVLALLFGVTNYTLMLFRGRPFLLIDLASIRTAMNVADSYSFSATPLFCVAAALMAVAAVLCFCMAAPREKIKSWTPVVIRLVSLAAVGLYVYGCLFTTWISGSGIKIRWNENEFEDSAVMYFMITTDRLYVSEPDGYSLDEVDKIASSIENTSASTTAVKPHVIAIMSESFSDLRVLGEFETNYPIMPFFDSWKEETLHGYVHSSVFGGNTANSEFEFMTGDSMAFIPTGSAPYQLYINYETDTLASVLKAQGYTSYAMHPHYSTGWNRPFVYKMFGFDNVMFREDFTGLRLLRGYVSDECDYNNIIKKFEAREPDEKMFILNVTMQNHSSYLNESFQNTAKIVGHEGEFQKAEQYLSVINLTDTATQKLIEYFSNVDEPVVILFFGDHQPRLDPEFYDMVYGKSTEELTLEEKELQYLTPFYIWSNYGLETGDMGETSINYLASILLDTAGLEKSDYFTFLSELRKTWPALSANGALDAEGNWNSLYDTKVVEDTGLNQYHILEYNHLFDTKHLRKQLFSLKDNSDTAQ